MAPRRFPPGFLWGTATSAHQVEGGNTNQWSEWERQPGHIWHEQRSGDACNWWHDAEQDFDRAAALGQNAHRLSIEWSRIEPVEGRFDDRAIQRYRQMLSALHARGIEPMVTLHHFTDPLWLTADGGWLDDRTPERFARFAEYAVQALGDLCSLWCTINEPVIFATMGYLNGEFPPGMRDIGATLRVARNTLLGHAAAAAAIRRVSPRHRVGLAHHVRPLDADSRSPLDLAVSALYDYLFNGVVLEALRTGRIPPPLGAGLRSVPDLAGSCDFFGLNYYTRAHVAFDYRASSTMFGRYFTRQNVLQSDAGKAGATYGEIYPAGLYRALKRVSKLGVPIYITETGLPDADDDVRPQFLLDHLAAVHRAIADGVDVRGVFVWSLVDNFEWGEGWGLRFGLYALDETTQQRTLRPSGALYAAIARANAIPGSDALSLRPLDEGDMISVL